jgi:hypothetical protein
MVNDIILLSREYDCAPLIAVRKQVETAVQNGKYDFQLAKVSEKGRILFEECPEVKTCARLAIVKQPWITLARVKTSKT